MREGVRDAFEHKNWGDRNTPRSGSGSTLDATAPLRGALPAIFERYSVKTFLDAPCGDWTWMQEVDLNGVHYIGGDISLEVVESVKEKHQALGREFFHLDITSDPLPKADLMMCRDCLFHLKWWLRWEFFENFAKSDIPYLLTTKHHNARNAKLRDNAAFKLFNPCAAPFNFPEPVEEISETGPYNDDPEFLQTRAGRQQRSVAIWSKEQVIDVLKQRETKT
ncbi:class I SAM-dependent methyltransferase [Ruegeria sp. ANG-R]|uniref:class I SAM-dependent methyltransferase n=1 Tax=Ruegeria sp. ANG-R TaxID=1577903 RepID=UPI000690C53E|nr:class I SAM-dependent methyltransferase [Ruegeria sp. ANG-R]